jgi:hypothetical protein
MTDLLEQHMGLQLNSKENCTVLTTRREMNSSGGCKLHENTFHSVNKSTGLVRNFKLSVTGRIV